MTVYGYEEAPDLTDGDTTIRPANAEEIGYNPITPVTTGGAHAGEGSLFDELLSMADEEVTNVQKFPVTYRPGGWVLEFNCVYTEREIKRYRNTAIGKKKRAEDADSSLFHAMQLLDKNTGIYKQTPDGLKQVLDGDEEPLLLNSTEFVTAFGKGGTAHQALVKFLGDAETINIGGAVLNAAGWGEDLEPLDPTEA
jgi:hypothetical protein